MIKNILVTGGAGYIGSHTVVQLIEKGYHPILVDNFSNSDPSIIERLEQITNTKITIFNVDLCDKEAINRALIDLKIDGIIHFAAFKAVGESVAHPLKYYKNNVLGLINILEWAMENNVFNILFSSSCTVYNEPVNDKFVTEESSSCKANSPYGTTKIIGEQILEDVKKSFPLLRILSLRYFNPVGAHTSGIIGEWPIGKPNNLLPFITQTAIGVQDQLVVFGNNYPTIDGTCVRDYIHVIDLADAHVLGLSYLEKHAFSNVEHINIGTGKGTSVLQFIEAFERLTQQKLNWKYGPERPGDIAEIYANVDKAKSKLGWTAKFTFEDAILDAWRWEQNIRK